MTQRAPGDAAAHTFSGGGMKDKYLAMICLAIINVVCVIWSVEYSREIIMMTVPVLAAITRD